MVLSYISVHTTKKSLYQDMKNLIDEYIKKTATETEVKEMLAQWKKTSGTLFLDFSDQDHPKVSARTRGMVGDKRGNIVQTLLDSMAE